MNYWDDLMATDEGAANYMESYGEGPGCGTRMIIGGFIKEGETVLDVGCGPGWNFDHFMKYGPAISSYKGLDYSERFVRVANKRVMDIAKTSSGPFELGDVRDIKEENYSWDVVILQDVLEHTNGYEKPIKEAIRVARNRVIVTFWRSAPDSNDQINDDGNDGYGANYSLKKFDKFLNKLGYKWSMTTTGPEANRQHVFYVINRREKLDGSRLR